MEQTAKESDSKLESVLPVVRFPGKFRAAKKTLLGIFMRLAHPVSDCVLDPRMALGANVDEVGGGLSHGSGGRPPPTRYGFPVSLL